MRAYVSGSLSLALFIVKDCWQVVDEEGHQRAAQRDEINLLFARTSDFSLFEFGDLEDLRLGLFAAAEEATAVFLAVSILDENLSLSLKLVSASALEDLLASSKVIAAVEEILLSVPMPGASRAMRDSNLKLTSLFPNISAIFRKLYNSQQYLDEVHRELREATLSLESEAADEIKARLIKDGSLRGFIRACQEPDVRSFNSVIVTMLVSASSNNTYKQVLSAIRAGLQKTFYGHHIRQAVLPIRRASLPAKRSATSNESIENLIASQHVGKFSALSSFEIKSSVDKQIAAIKRELSTGRTDLVQRYSEELVKFQLSHSEKAHLCKTLCLLASASLEANQLDIADMLSKAALDLGSSDIFAFTTRAEVLKGLGRFAAALEDYRQATVSFPASHYPWVGVADVLKEQGEYVRAREAYLLAQQKFPLSPVPFNGLVSVLRSEGKQRSALEEAKLVVRRFPDDAVSRSTLASALAANGRYDSAARQYKIALQSLEASHYSLRGYMHSLNSLGKTDQSLAIVNQYIAKNRSSRSLQHLLIWQLQTMGRNQLAHKVAQDVVRNAPGYLPARFDLAVAEINLGNRSSSLLSSMRDHNLRSEADWNHYRLFLGSLMLAEQYLQARDLILNASSLCVWERSKSHLKTMLAWCEYKVGDVSAASDRLQSKLETVDDRIKQTRLVLLGAIKQQSGDVSVGGAILRHLVKSKEPSILSVQEEALEKEGVVLPGTIFRLLAAA